MHLGHQYLIERNVALANKLNSKSVVITFSPNPFIIINKISEHSYHIISKEDKYKILSDLNIDILIDINFTCKMMKIEAELKGVEKKMYPTPVSRDHKDIGYQPSWKKSRDTSLPRQVLKNNKPGGKLNPEFVEFLMGYPMGWTEIEPKE